MIKSNHKVEFGDFQTPKNLAKEVISSITEKNSYESIIEPTCGLGSFLEVFLEEGTDETCLEGWEINPDYVVSANKRLATLVEGEKHIVREKDFFKIDWLHLKEKYKAPVLFIGNPPWVTNSELGKLLSKNLPEKYNFQNFTGLEAMTGKSNFDISEWMLIKLLQFISGTNSSIAFLIKTSVARKLFLYIAKHKVIVGSLLIREIDANKHFNVNVDACLFMASGASALSIEYTCPLYSNLSSTTPYKVMGVIKGKLVSDVVAYKELAHFDCPSEFKWRSGIKHDASKVMEFNNNNNILSNGSGEQVDLESHHLYPMYKSSHISKQIILNPVKYMLVTQKKIGNETKQIETLSPKTWQYLLDHSVKLDGRKSSIYKNTPRFAVFGVGDYTFSPWKIVISGLYKNLVFTKIGSYKDKPIVVDDTCYMLGLELEEQADFVLKIMTSELCSRFIQSLVFMDNKRPITVALLNRINIENIAEELNFSEDYNALFATKSPQLKLI